jgi:hypothetical protein
MPPDFAGKLNPHLNRCGFDGCPICKGTDFDSHAYAHVFVARKADDPTSISGGFPCAVIVCKRCGNVAFFNTDVVGQAAAPQPEDPPCPSP